MYRVGDKIKMSDADLDIKNLMERLSTTPDFLSSLAHCIEHIEEEGVDIRSIALFFYSQGYISHLEYQENKDKFRGISYTEIKK